MAGRIRAADIEEVKRRTNLAELVGDHVALKPGGIDSLKGLCPFHDERSPSFHVRPSLGYYHCFGCGESGDAITFVQKLEHLSFTEAVERLAARLHYVLSYEEGGERRNDGSNRARIFAANQAAVDYFRAQLASEEGAYAREFLAQRGFDDAACERFAVGYAPRGWDGLSRNLQGQGFTRQELVTAGLLSEGQRGSYDRFRGRVIWPIRDTSGQTVGFGARKLYDDDSGPKYLNTPETPIYHKSRVLYGLDLAKREISRERRVVVVEGYTDVMACHLAGERAAVATCGTAFGREHISVLRRIMGDDAAAEVIFTFDPDEAGQKAALRAFSDERLFRAQTYVALASEGLDPADLRLHRGDEAVRELFGRKIPLFEFALRQAVSRFDLNSVEGRISALRAAAPIIAEIKDRALRPGYSRELARMLGMDVVEVQRAVHSAGSQTGRMVQASRAEQQAPLVGNHRAAQPMPTRAQPALAALPQDPGTRLERDAVMAMLQQPKAIGLELLEQAVTAQLREPSLRVVRDVIAANLTGIESADWFAQLLAAAPAQYRELMHELALAPMPQNRPDQLASYARGIVVSLVDRDLLALKSEFMARLQRIGDPSDPGFRKIQEQLTAIDAARRSLRSA